MRGFTIVEVMVGTMILCIACFALMDLFPTSIQTLRKGQDMTCAVELAQQVLEQQRSTPFAQIAVGTQQSNTVIDGSTYQVKTVVSASSARLKVIVVTVTWDTKHTQAGASPAFLSLQTTVYAFTNP